MESKKLFIAVIHREAIREIFGIFSSHTPKPPFVHMYVSHTFFMGGGENGRGVGHANSSSYF